MTKTSEEEIRRERKRKDSKKTKNVREVKKKKKKKKKRGKGKTKKKEELFFPSKILHLKNKTEREKKIQNFLLLLSNSSIQ